MPKLSCVISSHHRPLQLLGLLVSLFVQTEQDIEILIADNSDEDFQPVVKSICSLIETKIPVRYFYAGCDNPYTSSNLIAQQATGEFISFPSDDGYYVPGYAEYMLAAARDNNWDLVLCELGDTPRQLGHYGVMCTKFERGYIDKTAFIVRRSQFTGFPEPLHPGFCDADWRLLNDLVQRGVTHGKIDQLLAIHN